jgi:RecJ-like exonuclease
MVVFFNGLGDEGGDSMKDAIEVSIIFHEGQRMFAVPKQPAPVQECLVCNGMGFIDGVGAKCRRCDGRGVTLATTPPAAQPAVPLTDEMVTAAARALNKRQAEACGVDKNDHWKFYGDDIKEDAKAALEAAHGITKGGAA